MEQATERRARFAEHSAARAAAMEERSRQPKPSHEELGRAIDVMMAASGEERAKAFNSFMKGAAQRY